jgi:hypothetical protein
MKFAESIVEGAALSCIEGLGYSVLHGTVATPSGAAWERVAFGQAILAKLLSGEMRVPAGESSLNATA